MTSDPPLDPRVVQVIRSSATHLVRFEGAFVQEFQAEISVRFPDLPAHGRAFCERMVRTLLWVATTGEPPRAIVDTLRWVGAKNRLEGFPEARYVDVAHALVRAVHNVSGLGWATSMGSAWVSYFLWTEQYLLAGAQQAAAEQAAAHRTAAEAVADPLDDEDEDSGYGQIMVSMTRNLRRERS